MGPFPHRGRFGLEWCTCPPRLGSVTINPSPDKSHSSKLTQLTETGVTDELAGGSLRRRRQMSRPQPSLISPPAVPACSDAPRHEAILYAPSSHPSRSPSPPPRRCCNSSPPPPNSSSAPPVATCSPPRSVARKT